MNKQPVSRRNFLKIAGFALGGMVLGCSGLGFLATRQPEVELIQMQCKGDTPETEKTLIIYASKCGSTGEVAEAIAEVLCDLGMDVDVKLAEEVTSLDGYNRVIIGSAVRMGNWLPAATNFVKAQQTQLAQLPTVIFSVHLSNLGDDEAAREARAAYTAPVHELITPQAEAFFAGKMDLARLDFLSRMIIKAMKSQNEDKRDWDTIRAWAREIAG
ncbi:MAG: flavodoxin domain-containing protein [Anaerolineae bacterium]|nr:flavodoxin domain-containing protein [Anaerolineae bacterium]